jgi:hypothetical protein
MAAGALLLASRRRLAPAALLSLLTAAASPVAALFLGLAALVWAWPRDARLLAALAGPATVLTGLTVLLFPEGGSQPFSAASFWPMLLLTAVAAALLPGRWRAAAVLTGLLLVAAFAIPTPLGSNALRLAPLAGPAVLLAAGRGPRPLVLLAVAGLLYLQLQTAERAVLDARGDPATHARFYTPLLGFLDGAARPGDRVEVAFTRTHWETAFVAERHPIARGWERQLDRRVNPLFYDSKPLTAARYEAWLRAEGIRWVALADAPLDFSARQEAKLLERGQPFLRAAFAGPGWRAWELRGPPRPVEGAATITGEGPTEIRLRVDRPGRVLVRRRHSPYLTITGGCVTEAAGGWIELRMRRPGTAVLGSSLTGRGPECGP